VERVGLLGATAPDLDEVLHHFADRIPLVCGIEANEEVGLVKELLELHGGVRGYPDPLWIVPHPQNPSEDDRDHPYEAGEERSHLGLALKAGIGERGAGHEQCDPALPRSPP
jgi:hypothetical protein